MGQQLINELGNKYGLLTVKELTKDKNGRTAWRCECDCGNEKIARGSDLRKGKITACGTNCKLKYLRNGNFKNLTGQRFGRLEVLSFKEINNNHHSVWHCKCDCGNECDALGPSLTNGKKQSCGCLHREIVQNMSITHYVGEIIGHLTIIDKIYDENNYIKWRCKCQCGTIKDYTGVQLCQTTSCGCKNSRFEGQIYSYLKNKNIDFKEEQRFSDLVSAKNHCLRYDFAIYKNDKIIGLIEFQGDQHFKPVERFGGEEGFEIRIRHDRLKYLYAILHDIPLLYLIKESNIENKINLFLEEIKYYEV